MKQIKVFEINDIEEALKEIAKHNGFDWDYWLVPLIKMYFEGRQR